MTNIDPKHYRSLLESVVRGKRWIVAMDVLIPAARFAKILLDYGATDVLAIGASRGTGDLPDPEVVRQIELGAKAKDMMSGIRNGMRLLADLPSEVRAEVDRFDPGGEARVIGALFSDGSPVAGRSQLGARPVSWQVLEDKTTIDELWREVGVPHAEVEIVEARLESLRAACVGVARGEEVVIAGDNKEGFHGGAQYVRWIRNEGHLVEAAQFFAAHCDRVRVMPFLEGVPCSIHGVVFSDEVIALRPCEMLVLRDPAAGRFVYASAATFWEPHDTMAQEMRLVARKLGEHLRERYDYRGVFTLDGVATKEGFRPTELNPRFGAALMRMTAGLEDFSVYLLHLVIAEGLELDYRPHDLQQLLIDFAQANPSGGGMQLVSKVIEVSSKGGLVREPSGWRLGRAGEAFDASFELGPSAMGGLVRVDLDRDRTPRGPSSAERVAGALGFLGQHFDLDLPPMAAPRES